MTAIAAADATSPVRDATPLLDVSALSLRLGTRGVPVIRDVSFSLQRGERVAIVGESGCGKSMTGLTLMRLLPLGRSRIAGRIVFDGQDLLSLSDRHMRDIRGREMAMIFQEPMSALDPVFTIGDQISEAYRVHVPASRSEARERAIEALKRVRIPAPDKRYHDYPHQLSGGMRQRVMIAMALICSPKLLIADEPTTALDVTIQSQITDLLSEVSEQAGAALLFITHDLGVVAETCTRVITMYAGEVVEDAPVDDILIAPGHPYTSGILRSLPGLAPRRSKLPSIPGQVPSLHATIVGCGFRERCGFALDACAEPQRLDEVGSGRLARCWRAPSLSLPGIAQ